MNQSLIEQVEELVNFRERIRKVGAMSNSEKYVIAMQNSNLKIKAKAVSDGYRIYLIKDYYEMDFIFIPAPQKRFRSNRRGGTTTIEPQYFYDDYKLMMRKVNDRCGLWVKKYKIPKRNVIEIKYTNYIGSVHDSMMYPNN